MEGLGRRSDPSDDGSEGTGILALGWSGNRGFLGSKALTSAVGLKMHCRLTLGSKGFHCR